MTRRLPALLTVCLAMSLGELACESRPAVKCTEEAATTATPAVVLEPARTLSVKNQCIFGTSGFIVHVLMPSSYTFNPALPDGTAKKDYRTIWTLQCQFKNRECTGVRLDLDHVEVSGELPQNDVTSIIGASIVASSPSTATINWGGMRTITIDRQLHKVRFVESSPGGSEGRGEVDCAER